FVERQLDGAGIKLDVPASETLGQDEASVEIELLAGSHIRDSQLEHHRINLRIGRAAVLLGRGGDCPDGAVWSLEGSAVPPQGFGGLLDDCRAGVAGVIHKAVYGGWLGDDKRHRKSAKAGGRRLG